MSKKVEDNPENIQEQETTQTDAAQQPKGGASTFVDELLGKGTVTITAKTREALAEMLAQIPSDVKYGTGAVGKNYETGEYVLRLDIIT